MKLVAPWMDRLNTARMASLFAFAGTRANLYRDRRWEFAYDSMSASAPSFPSHE
jgi:hypothetical protein